MARRFLIAVAVMALGAVFVAPSAHAAFGIEKWEAQTCKEDKTATAEPCLGTETGKLFTQSSAHPNFGVTAFKLNSIEVAPGSFVPEGNVKDIRVELPRGLGVNPEATPKCTVAQLEAGPAFVTECPPASRVGTDFLTAIVAAGPPPVVATIPVPVYNVQAPFGVPSQAGFRATGPASFLVGDLDPVDQHISFNTEVESPAEGGPPVIGSRLVFNGQAGDGYLTMPSECDGGQTTVLKVDSYQAPGVFKEAKSTTLLGADGCEKVPFKPTVGVAPEGAKATDSPEPVTVELGLPYEKEKAGGITNSYLKTAKVILPEGMGINPSSANGLEVCTDAQFAKGTNDPVSCPGASKIGTVTVETPSLPAGSVGGAVYVGEPLKNGAGAAESGEQFRIFIHAAGPKRGVNVRLIGKVFPNLVTGQLTAIVEENPEAPFSSFQVHFNGGPKGTLTSPPTCGPNKTTTDLTPWSGNLDANTPSSEFNLTSYPGGGNCPKSLAERPFAPGYTAKSDSTMAGAYSPFKVHIGRPDGQQELKVVNVTLPKGLTGKLAGIPYCPEDALAAAAASSGKAQQAGSSCSAASEIGTTSTEVGSGSAPFKIAGKAFLAGPYKGAPLSMAVITPGVAGPYDIGTVVVRAALNVNPETGQINAVSDPIPDVFDGVKLDVRSIDVDVNRSKFMLNPTNCAAAATSGTINGGGSNPTDPAAFSSYAVSAAYQATECNKLAFKPKLFTRLYGPTKRAKNPRIRAILEAREGDANLSRAALTLPHSLFLDQSHIKTVCTRVQLAAKECPQNSIYGQAEAKSPLLDNKLKGPVYLVSSSDKLPNLVADLKGQVNVQLRGVISSKRGGLKTVFPTVPDLPVKKFILNMKGGKKSLLVNSTNTCDKKQTAVLNLGGQNGKKVKNNKYKLNISSCGKKKNKK
jgi:hypothetical protein